MEDRRRIRDMTYAGERWIASVAAEEHPDGVWRGHVAFFVDAPAKTTHLDDPLVVEAFAFDEIVAQAAALSVDELRRRLERLLGISAA